MAISFVATRSTGTSAAAGASWGGLTLATGASITPGNTLIMALSYRDALNPPVDARPQPGNGIGYDSRNNLWRRVAVAATAGASSAADDGAVVALWVCHVVFPYQNGDVVTITAPIVAAPLTHISGAIQEFSGIERTDSGVYVAEGFAGTGTAVAVTGIQPTAAGQLVYAACAVGSNPALTGDADVTDGAWSAIGTATTGVGGITRGIQTKTVTGTATQSWDVTWAGSQPWAGVAVVFGEASTPWPFNNTYLANDDFPCPAGPQIIPIATTNTPVDTGTAYIFNAPAPPESSGSSGIYWQANLTPLDPGVDTQHTVVAEVYPQGFETVYNEPVVINFGVPYAATLRDGATTTSGTAVAALAAVGGEQVVLEATQSVDCYWDFTEIASLLGRYRVVDVRLNYLAWKDDSAAPQPGEGLAVYWRDEDAVGPNARSRYTSLYAAWLVNEYENNARRTYRSLGEINGVPQIGATSNMQYGNLGACFTLADFLRMNPGVSSTMLSIYGLSGSAPSQTTVFLDTIELELVLVPEYRLAHSARRVSTGVGFPRADDAISGSVLIPMYNAASTDTFWEAPTNGDPLTVVLREGVPASPSDWFAAQYDPGQAFANFAQSIRYSSQERVGPSVAVNSIVQPRGTIDPVPEVSVVAWSAGQIAPNSTPVPANALIHEFFLIDLNSYQSFWPAYATSNVLELGYGATVNAGSSRIGVDGATAYDYVRVIVQAPVQPGAPDLNISIEQPTSVVLATATVTQAQVLALPDIGNGYREVHVPLSAIITPSASSDVEIYYSSTTSDADQWVLAFAAEQTGGRTIYQPDPQDEPTLGTNRATILSCPLPDVDADIDSNEVDLQNNGNTPCVTSPSNIPCITINNAEQYDWLTIERIVGVSDTTPVALIDVNGEITYPTLEVEDDFERTVVGGWGDPTVGPTWDTVTNTVGGTFDVNNGRGVMSFPNTSNALVSAAGQTVGPFTRQQVRVSLPEVPSGGSMRVALYATDGVDDQYFVLFSWTTSGTAVFEFRRFLAGFETLIGSYTYEDIAAGQWVYLALDVSPGVARGKSWLDGQSEPAWQFTQAIPVGMSAFTSAAMYGQRRTGNTSVTPDIYFDDYELLLFTPQQIEWCDYGVPWDLPNSSISYRVQGFRNSDHRTTPYTTVVWGDTSPAAGAAFGLATDDGLFAYNPGSDSGELELQWNRLYPVEMMPLAGKDYQIALRPSEVRGYSITTNILVDKLSYCTSSDESGVDDGTYDGLGIYDDDNFYDFPASSPTSEEPGAKGMAPTPFQQLNQFERTTRMTLKLPGGHTRVVYFDSGAQTLIPVIGLAMSECTLTDTTPVSIEVPLYPETS
jgi:hypothetical protein